MDVGLVDALCDYSRPVFLFGLTPPLEGATQDELKETARKFVERSATLATDGFIVYDIQEEKGRTPEPRPFPFRKLDDPSHFASVLKDVSGKESVVYKCVAESDPGGFDGWLNKAIDTFGVNAYNLVGGASSANQYSGPTIPDVAAKLNKRPQCAHGGVTIAERHVKKGNEHETLVRKGELGMRWFISQAIYDPEPMIKLLKEYGALCKQKKIAPKRIVLTFAPCGREKTMRFIKWLGVTVPEDVEKEILEADDKVGKSVDLLCAMCRKILDETKGCGVPLGISVESVSIFKNEINAAQRQRVAAKDRAEAEKIMVVKAAEADAESKYLSGTGMARQRQAIINGLRDSVVNFQKEVDGISSKDVMEMMMMTQYFDTMKEVGTQGGNSTIFVPSGPAAVADASAAIRSGLMQGNAAIAAMQR